MIPSPVDRMCNLCGTTFRSVQATGPAPIPLTPAEYAAKQKRAVIIVWSVVGFILVLFVLGLVSTVMDARNR